MAKIKSRGNGRTTPRKGQGTAVVKATIIPSDELGYHYVNHAEVGHSQHEFYILWGRLPTKLSALSLEEATRTGSLPIAPLVQLQFPASMIGGVITALTEQRAKYEKRFGPIKDTWKVADK